jgi:hypothetical protein
MKFITMKTVILILSLSSVTVYASGVRPFVELSAFIYKRLFEVISPEMKFIKPLTISMVSSAYDKDVFTNQQIRTLVKEYYEGNLYLNDVSSEVAIFDYAFKIFIPAKISAAKAKKILDIFIGDNLLSKVKNHFARELVVYSKMLNEDKVFKVHSGRPKAVFDALKPIHADLIPITLIL